MTGCAVHLPQVWSEAFASHRVPLDPGESLIPIAISADGSAMFAARYGRDWKGVLRIEIPSGRRTKIRQFNKPADQAIAGDGDGHWFVWTEDFSTSALSDWELRSWDAETGEVGIVATVPHVHGRAVEGPYVYPVVEHGRVAWTAVDANGAPQLHLYDLTSRTDTVVSSNHPGAPVFSWPWLVWAESSSPGVAGHLEMMSMETGRRVARPHALDSVRPAFMAGAPGALAWVDAERSGYRRLRRWSASGVVTVAMAPRDDYAEFPYIAGPLVTWTSSTTTYVGDSRSGTYTQVTPRSGIVLAKGSALLVAFDPLNTRTDHPRLEITALLANELPRLPYCK